MSCSCWLFEIYIDINSVPMTDSANRIISAVCASQMKLRDLTRIYTEFRSEIILNSHMISPNSVLPKRYAANTDSVAFISRTDYSNMQHRLRRLS